MTLVELLVAVFILTVAILALAAVAAQSLSTVRVARDRDHSTRAASTRIEELRALPYEELAINDASLSSSDPYVHAGGAGDCGSLLFDSDLRLDGTDGSAPAEEIHTSGGGAIAPYLQTQDNLTIRTFVTWYNDPSFADGDPCTNDAKRVTVVVTWDDPRAGPKEVRESTIISDTGGRGDPLHLFQLIPTCTNPLVACDLSVEPPTMTQTALSSQTACFNHTLQNFGSPDTYEITYAYNGTSVTATGGSVVNVAGWKATAWLGENAGSPALMEDDGDSDFDPDSDVEVPRNDDAPLIVCYQPTSTAQYGGNLTVTLTSEEVPSSSDQIGHVVQNGSSAGTVFFLHDGGTAPSSCSGARPIDRDRADRAAEYTMDGTTPTADVLVDYDCNLDLEGNVPGLYLAQEDRVAPIYQGRWQGTYDTTVTSAKVVLWVSGRDNAKFGIKGNKSLAVDVRLERVVGGVPTTIFQTEDRNVSVSTPGWTRFEFSLTSLNSDPFGAAGQPIRLVIECDSTSTNNDCHLAYDTYEFPARLVVN